MLPKMQKSHFVKKHSVQFVNAQRETVGAVLFLGQQAARVLADLAGGAQRVRPDDAEQRPRARRRRAGRRARAGRAVRRRSGGRREDSRRAEQRSRGVRESRRRRERTERDASEPVQAAALGSGAQQGRDLDVLGRAPIATPAATRARRSSCRPPTSRDGSGTSRCTTTSSASAWSRRSITCSRGARATRRPTRRKSRARRR